MVKSCYGGQGSAGLGLITLGIPHLLLNLPSHVSPRFGDCPGNRITECTVLLVPACPLHLKEMTMHAPAQHDSTVYGDVVPEAQAPHCGNRAAAFFSLSRCSLCYPPSVMPHSCQFAALLWPCAFLLSRCCFHASKPYSFGFTFESFAQCWLSLS